MLVLLIRLLMFALIFFIIYSIIKYLLSSKRKLELAHEQKKYFLYDDVKNVRKNFLLTYKGVLFEGEKYLGTTERSFEVVSIFVWVKNPSELKGLTRDDFKFIESKLKSHYPNSKLDWKSPIKEFLQPKDRF
ncbi:sigma-w pathway protein ysdB [Cytobacillus sp. S13-E01]|uniref:sigma-w pathway protein ysdB n=1 Tax=Cytobacillus sp. S13-E01 TaxID=3031326 RepID=UPI0023D7D7EB|nr:sigma-w pathway protein ysdB [Cytobacillus sp. S13-E01]MDF0727479.1 sigma-w pathway protein ysdB [Cytobacillus sp. S13-E01]